MDFGIAGTRAEMERRFAPTLAQQLSRLCVVILVQIAAADYVAHFRLRNGSDICRRFLSVDGGRVGRSIRTLYFFTAGFAAQSVAHAHGLSSCRDGVGRAPALLDFSHCLPLEWGRDPFREHCGLRVVALAWRDGFSGFLFFADGCFQQSMESV